MKDDWLEKNCPNLMRSIEEAQPGPSPARPVSPGCAPEVPCVICGELTHMEQIPGARPVAGVCRGCMERHDAASIKLALTGFARGHYYRSQQALAETARLLESHQAERRALVGLFQRVDERRKFWKASACCCGFVVLAAVLWWIL